MTTQTCKSGLTSHIQTVPSTSSVTSNYFEFPSSINHLLHCSDKKIFVSFSTIEKSKKDHPEWFTKDGKLKSHPYWSSATIKPLYYRTNTTKKKKRRTK
jgi:hypothetical protein